MYKDEKRISETIYKELEKNDGILKLKPSWVTRDFLISGKRLGLKEEEYNAGKRGEICERWIASTTFATNKKGPEDEGLSYIKTDYNYPVSLLDAIKVSKDLLMGKEYSNTHNTFGRLIKVFCFGKRLFYHYHQMQKDAELAGFNGKDEAYYFPEDTDLGVQPESFFGVHPYINEQKKYDILLPYLENWNNDLILKHSRAYMQVSGEGFYLPSGIPHAPGTALTIELQEESDVFANLQALLDGKILSKEDTLFRNIRKEDKEKFGGKVILDQIDWERSGDPYFYENHRTAPILIKESVQEGGEEYWIFYNTEKFSGKKLIVKPGKNYISLDKSVYTVLVWKGKGLFNGQYIEAEFFDYDEFIVSHDTAIKPILIENKGNKELVLFKFFGKDTNKNIPVIKSYKN